MLHFTSEVVTRENAFQINEIEARRLEQLQTQLESFNLQVHAQSAASVCRIGIILRILRLQCSHRPTTITVDSCFAGDFDRRLCAGNGQL